jgi:NADH-quinone oxidoreductase subunit F
LAEVANGIAGNSICALGDAAAWPMLGFLTKFRADFEARLPKAAQAS